MLNNLKAELTRKGLKPEKAVEAVLSCTYQTAKAKLDGISDFTIPEAIQIMEAYFREDDFNIAFLFSKSGQQSA